MSVKFKIGPKTDAHARLYMQLMQARMDPDRHGEIAILERMVDRAEIAKKRELRND